MNVRLAGEWGVEFRRCAVSLSDALVDSDFLGMIRQAHGAKVVEEWDTSVFICGWAPFSSTGFPVADPGLLRRQVSSHLAKRLRSLR